MVRGASVEATCPETTCPKTGAAKTTILTDRSFTLAEILVNTRNLLHRRNHQYRKWCPPSSLPSFTKMLDFGMHSRVDTALMKHGSTGKTLRSGAFAKATGMSSDTIGHYEKIGILPRALRTQSGYRASGYTISFDAHCNAFFQRRLRHPYVRS